MARSKRSFSLYKPRPEFHGFFGNDSEIVTCSVCLEGSGDVHFFVPRDEIGHYTDNAKKIQAAKDNLRGFERRLGYILCDFAVKGEIVQGLMLQEKRGFSTFECPGCGKPTLHFRWGPVRTTTFVASMHDRGKAEASAKRFRISKAARDHVAKLKAQRAARWAARSAGDIPAGPTKPIKPGPGYKRVKRKTAHNVVEKKEKGAQ